MQDRNPISIRRIDHVVIRANDLAGLSDFYVRVLGCRLEKGPGEGRLAQLRAGDSLIDLVEVGGPYDVEAGLPPDRSAPNVAHICLQVEPWEIDAIMEHLARSGVQASEVEDRYGARGYGPSLYICDPEGNTIELKDSSLGRTLSPADA